jgi:hypothetical protein
MYLVMIYFVLDVVACLFEYQGYVSSWNRILVDVTY